MKDTEDGLYNVPHMTQKCDESKVWCKNIGLSRFPWHDQLSQLHQDVVQHVISSMNKVLQPNCSHELYIACQLSKSHHLPFPNSAN